VKTALSDLQTHSSLPVIKKIKFVPRTATTTLLHKVLFCPKLTLRQIIAQDSVSNLFQPFKINFK